MARASVEDIIAEIRIPKSSAESEVSPLSSCNQADEDSLTSENTTETTSHEDPSLKTPELKSRIGGRPKGSTKVKKKKDKETKSKCTDTITFEYSRQHNTAKSVGGKVEYGDLKRLIDEKKKEFGINISISSRTIKNRIQRGSLTTPHGAKSPLEEVEVALVEICIQMGKIRQPLSCTKAITLMNDMIENTNTKQKLIEFQQSRKLGTYGFEKGKVTSGWWRGFLRRHEDKLVTKRGEKFALNRHDWTTLPNIKQMYDVIYDEMVDACVAVSLQIPIFTDINGIPEDHETKRFGLAQPIKITKPEWILFADESGFIMSQKKDGGMLVVRNLSLNEEQPHRQWHQQQITNLPRSRSLQHLARQFVVLCNNVSGKRESSCHLEN